MVTRTLKLFSYTALAALVLFALVPAVFAQVTTDKNDYSPGETVTISGDGYSAAEEIQIEVTAPYGSVTGTTTTNGSGEFSWQFTLPSDDSSLGQYSYTATGQSSGISFSGAFTDGNVKIFPIPTTATYSATKTIYDDETCTGNIVSGPTVENGISSPSGHTTGVGNTESVEIQAAAFSDQGGAFLGWTTSAPYVGTSTTAVSGDTLCVSGSFTGNRSYFANYGDPSGVLVVQKVLINDNGGTAATTTFSFQINGASTTPFNTQGSVSFSLASSTYSVTELAAAGYTTTYSNSKNGSANCTNLSVTSLATTTCTITNNDIAPTLTLVKVVVNDDGGTATTTDWTLTATGPTGFSGAGPIVGSGASFDAGSYDLSESGPSGYSASAWVCQGGNQTDDDTVEIGLGENVTCTITNDDRAASLTLVKVVINDDGGVATTTDWTLTATGPTGFSGFGPSVINADIHAGTYDLSENGPSGYTASAWVCQGGNQTDDDTVVIGLGETVTCTITNDDVAPQPPLGACVRASLSVASIRIIVCNNGTIDNTTSGSSATGNNTADGSEGGTGGSGGAVSSIGKGTDDNNGGASGGSGGSGARAGRGGFVSTGNASSTAATINEGNRTSIRVGT